MIVELRVRDLATIADVALQCGPGLNVLTGETGAGKSILIDALALLLGERADSALVRPGAARCVVEGAFDTDPAFRRRLDALGLDAEEDRVVIRREVSAEGRSRAWVNGSPTTLTALSELGAALVDLHGQHETQSLLRPDAQRDILDAYAGAQGARQSVEGAWRDVQALREQEDGLVRQRDEVKRRADYLRHVVTEIRDAKLKAGEDEKLEAEARKLSHAGTLGEQARRLAESIDGEDAGALTAMGNADRALTQLERQDPDTAKWRELLDGAFANLTELARLASEYADGISDDPKRQATVEARRDLLFKLTQKHGGTLDAVIATGEQAAKELDLLDTADTDLRALAARREAAEGSLKQTAAALTEKRSEAAGRLGRAVGKLLPKLGLPGGKLEVQMEPLPEPQAHGGERVEFTVRLNQGHDARPL
ncbi:MAG TPA: AAA family ATPase, partial [Gemmatimonadales bacterium]|nr:AAA family ATPase [Gemmatimonadales bacterium]